MTSETFVRLWTAPDVRVATVKAYLFAIARNLYLQGLRRNRHVQSLDDAIEDPRPTPEAHAASREELRHVLARLRALSEVERAALLMRVEHELTYEDIAAALNISTAAAKVRVHRARLKLAAAMEDTSWKSPET